jgi:hypothetical protein
LHEDARIETLCLDSGEAPQIAMQDQRPDDETPFFHVLSRRPNPAAAPGRAEPLTDRELEALRLLAAGKSSQRSARDLVVHSARSKARDLRPGQARRRQPHRGRRAARQLGGIPDTAPSRLGNTFG